MNLPLFPVGTEQYYKQAGYIAFRLGKSPADCKLRANSQQLKWWRTGYDYAKKKNAPLLPGCKRPAERKNGKPTARTKRPASIRTAN